MVTKFAASLDRKPIDPPPIIQLQIRDLSDPAQYDSLDDLIRRYLLIGSETTSKVLITLCAATYATRTSNAQHHSPLNQPSQEH